MQRLIDYSEPHPEYAEPRPMGGLSYPIKDSYGQWCWFREFSTERDKSPISGRPLPCEVNRHQFSSMIHYQDETGAVDGGDDQGIAWLGWPTKDMALAAAERAGVLVASWWYDEGPSRG